MGGSGGNSLYTGVESAVDTDVESAVDTGVGSVVDTGVGSGIDIGGGGDVDSGGGMRCAREEGVSNDGMRRLREERLPGVWLFVSSSCFRLATLLCLAPVSAVSVSTDCSEDGTVVSFPSRKDLMSALSTLALSSVSDTLS
jgi:hypothetical protein